jgi:hypothetical protein
MNELRDLSPEPPSHPPPLSVWGAETRLGWAVLRWQYLSQSYRSLLDASVIGTTPHKNAETDEVK